MNQEPRDHAWIAALRGALGVRVDEAPVVGCACGHFFFLMAGYCIIQPICGAMGLTGGVEDLQWLFLLTLLVMLPANPVFAALVGRFPRRVFVPAVYAFFVLQLLVFYALFNGARPGHDIHVARAFFVWVSVFNLFLVSLFWALMADAFTAEQGKRLFGLIGVGGTLGAIVGAASTAWFAGLVGEVNLIPVSAALLVLACGCALRTRCRPQAAIGDVGTDPDRRLGGSVLAGVTHIARSPYLIAICLLLCFEGLSATFAYLAQGTIVGRSLDDRDQRAALLASIDLVANVVAAVIQVFLTGRIVRRIGVGRTLALLPLVFLGGFACLGLSATLTVLFATQVLLRAVTLALARPARESLFTVLPREDKYKAKNFIDTVVYRGGDAVGAALFALLTSQFLGLGLPGTLLVALPVTAGWVAVALYLGRRQHRLAQPSPWQPAP